ncbi:SDR family NAD(P)-dependent oxidoreductase [Deferrisoma camini]|uniref:SDR family NAD(P)-dependent oxidoreductase n=1 Tax=Deferrisoma camini TaxID=1035120 RepID=UPI00046C9350|nr:SDR family NAD(P)-dependent oxidoreductase [Deferrisoma camini]
MERMLEGKVSVITGAGRGIGRSAALLFASEGARVVVSDLDEGPAREVVDEIRARGGEAVAVVGDVTAEGFAERLVQTAVESFGPSIDVLVNNAGYTWDGVVHKMTDEQWEAMWRVHCTAPFRIVRAAAPYIRDAAKRDMEQGRRVHRKIINVSSVAGTDGNPGQINYSTAKAGILGFTRTLAREWGRFNVNVNAVAYGWIETRLTRAKDEDTVIEAGGTRIPVGVPRQQLEVFRALIPLGRPGTPEEAARVMLFLASPLSDYVSGQVIKVTGGW